MDQIEVMAFMVFNTTQAWVTRSEPEFLLGEEKVAYTCSYTYLGVTITGGCLCPTFSWCSQKTMCTFANLRATS